MVSGDSKQGGSGRGAARKGGQRGPEASSAYPEPMQRLLSSLSQLPGIGRRSAERLAFHLLKGSEADALDLARSIADTKKLVRHCPICFNLTMGEGLCSICEDPKRTRGQVLVVEQPRDLIAIEQTGMYRGLFHVLMGRLSPLDGVGPEELTVEALMQRVKQPSERQPGGEAVGEVILGLSPDLEGDGTTLYLRDALEATGVRVTRLARGLPSGGTLEYAGKAALADAIEGRRGLS